MGSESAPYRLGARASYGARGPRALCVMTISRHVRSSSSFCGNPSQGAEFDAVGHLVEPDVDVYVTYTVKGCDNGPPGFGVDTWSVDIPSRSYHKDGSVTGDIMKQ